MRDSAPLGPELDARLAAVDVGHPTLTELRAALGPGLALYRANDPGRGVRTSGEAQSDEELARVLDAMYGTLTSPRIVSVQIDEGSVQASRQGEAIVVREGPLSLWVRAQNETGEPVELTARGSGAVVVAAGRSGSMLVQVGPVAPGEQRLALEVVAGGRRAGIEVPVECHAAGKLRVVIVDDASGEPVAARIYLADEVGAAWPDGAVARRDVHGNVFFHADGGFEAQVSGTARLRVVRGIEYQAAEPEIVVKAGTMVEVEVRCRRWSHLAAEGWFSGDVHVHLHYGGEYLLLPADAALVQRAEDVHFLNMMVANQGSGWVHDREHFTGADHELSEGGHILRWGEEYRNDFYGHMCMFGIEELVPPIYAGVPNSEHPMDLPANAHAAAHCHAVGGTLSYAHPMFQSIELDRVFALEHRQSVEAKELPVDAALGQIDAMDVLSYPGNTAETCKLWYRLLNCGLRLAATAGTDTFMNYCNLWAFSNPPAGDRAFVRVDGAFSTETWCEGVRRGRTFVTNGPILRLDVGGHEAGDEVEAQVGDVLQVQGVMTSAVPADWIELVVNGAVVAASEVGADGSAALDHELQVTESCWVALRCSGPVHEQVLDPEGAFAHTSPVYVTVDGAPVRRAEDASYFVEWIERLIAMTEEHGQFPSDAEREGVIALFREGQAYYGQLA